MTKLSIGIVTSALDIMYDEGPYDLEKYGNHKDDGGTERPGRGPAAGSHRSPPGH